VPAFYERLEETGPGGSTLLGRYRSTRHTAGPWDQGLQHAGPPTALLTRAVERLGHGPPSPLVARVTVEILAPVPVTDLTLRATVERPGRRVAWCTGVLATAADPESPLVRMQAWVLRRSDSPLDVPATPRQAVPAAGVETGRPRRWNPGYLDAVAWRAADGEIGEPGPATVWTRLTVAVVDDEEPSGAQRVVAVADSGSGISAVADPARLLFVNTDLTVHLYREPVGEEIWMSAATSLDSSGVGLARTTLGDHEGDVGSAAQALFVAVR
jgi:hypothetical protein